MFKSSLNHLIYIYQLARHWPTFHHPQIFPAFFRQVTSPKMGIKLFCACTSAEQSNFINVWLKIQKLQLKLLKLAKKILLKLLNRQKLELQTKLQIAQWLAKEFMGFVARSLTLRSNSTHDTSMDKFFQNFRGNLQFE